MLRPIKHHVVGALVALFGVAACSSPPATSSGDRGQPIPVSLADMSQFYRELGLIVSPPPLSIVGKVSYFASPSPDTTLVLVTISLPNRALTFSREGDRYRAPYEVRLRISAGGVEAASLDALEVVRVGTFKEINRSDESVIFQHFFRIAPGMYSLSVALRDVGGSRNTSQEASLVVPRLRGGAFSSPLLTYESSFRASLDSMPRILASPRSTAVFGRDSLAAVFIEAYGSGDRLPITYRVINDAQAAVLRDSTFLQRHGNLFAGVVNVPISPVGLGLARLVFARAGSADTASLPIFVSFGEDIPIMSFENMIEYLRFYAAPWRLKTLRDALAAKRASAWAAFLRDTDPVPETAINEDLEAYFARIQVANVQFANDRNPGWLSDRGMVFVALGEPNQTYERTIPQAVTNTQIGQTSHVQVWDYPQYHTQLVFYEDVTRWRLTRASENQFWLVTNRKLAH